MPPSVVKKKNIKVNAEMKTIADYALILDRISDMGNR